MKPEILDFYNTRAFEPYKFIRKRKKAPKIEIFWAMEEVYKEIQNGLQIDNIKIPKKVLALIDSPNYEELEKYRDDVHDLIEAEQVIDGLKAEIDKWKRYAYLGYILAFWAASIASTFIFKDLPCY